MFRKLQILTLTALLLVAALAFAAPARADAPSFSPHIYADGQVWGTKGLSELPMNDGNLASFDLLFIFTNGGNPAQLPVSDYGPGSAGYNGGRWYAHSATWSQAYLASVGGMAPLVTSYSQLMMHVSAGHLMVAPGHPFGGPTFFLCPLLPVK